ncbi:MAG: toll/interleukin-1 receptor domain-containing protein [Chloroflexota bacterium]
MRVMISHEHRESALAQAVKELLEILGQGRIYPWYSSDTRPEGGVGTGEWWNILHDQIESSDYVIAVLTEESARRPWIIWECGLAAGQENTRAIIPVTFHFAIHEMPGPLAGFQTYRGDKRKQVIKLVQMLCSEVRIELSSTEIELAMDKFDRAVDEYFKGDLMARLFGKGFHKRDDALSGMWRCTWYDDEGQEFEQDTIEVVMYDDRVRVIGKGAKGFPYPMEGRISSERYITLTYWSIAQIPTSGSALLKIHPLGSRMKGEWIGHTTRSYDEDGLTIIRGKVEWEKLDA